MEPWTEHILLLQGHLSLQLLSTSFQIYFCLCLCIFVYACDMSVLMSAEVRGWHYVPGA